MPRDGPRLGKNRIDHPENLFGVAAAHFFPRTDEARIRQQRDGACFGRRIESEYSHVKWPT